MSVKTPSALSRTLRELRSGVAWLLATESPPVAHEEPRGRRTRALLVWLFSREQLPDLPLAPARRSGRAGLGWLFGREHLAADAIVPPNSSRFALLGWLFRNDKLASTEVAQEPQQVSFWRWLLRPEALHATSTVVDSEKHDAVQ